MRERAGVDVLQAGLCDLAFCVYNCVTWFWEIVIKHWHHCTQDKPISTQSPTRDARFFERVDFTLVTDYHENFHVVILSVMQQSWINVALYMQRTWFCSIINCTTSFSSLHHHITVSNTRQITHALGLVITLTVKACSLLFSANVTTVRWSEMVKANDRLHFIMRYQHLNGNERSFNPSHVSQHRGWTTITHLNYRLQNH